MNSHTLITLGVLGGLATSGCTPAYAQPPEAPSSSVARANSQGAHGAQRGFRIRAYDVPDGSAVRYRSMARTLLKGSRSRGEVAIAPDGRLVIAASASVHADLASLFERTGEVAPAPVAVALTYWVVSAKRASAPVTAPVTEPALAEIGDSLSALSKRQGGLSFRLVDRIAIQSSTEARASHRGERTEVEQLLQSRGGVLVADLKIRTEAGKVGSLSTRVAVVPDKAMIIGETAVGEGTDETLIYLVRATVQR